ncbi:methylglyoxal synthase [Roseibium aquae]|uniref:Methylglyoxal synthase n=1 Tax=Roseibium aquae TaxID=1323746 RepID=A0A916TLQ0_9HYPH|nr:methylglyoxal synthase [Roseibium aquae]GGB57643.1 methylglyoxal synthase [Roseibium aquae]
MKPTLALVAHDAKKDAIAAFAERNAQKLSDFSIVATGTTGGRIMDACPALDVTRVRSGPLGGDQQIGAMIAEGRLNGLIFFIDPLTPMPHDVDVKALLRLAVLYDLPTALNVSTAEILLRSARLAGLQSTSKTPEVSLIQK